MKQLLALGLFVFMLSCEQKKVIHLPEISHSKITEIHDVSPAYLFYDETKPDRVELNRKNLISTTNWLVNIDKRLTLKQVIPHITFLQDKKANSAHKNKQAKNYFTCHDISRSNLGFIDFTSIIYKEKKIVNVLADMASKPTNELVVHFISPDDIKINSFFEEPHVTHSSSSKLNQNILALLNKNSRVTMNLCFYENLSFEDYIAFKSELSKLTKDALSISQKEFISN